MKKLHENYEKSIMDYCKEFEKQTELELENVIDLHVFCFGDYYFDFHDINK